MKMHGSLTYPNISAAFSAAVLGLAVLWKAVLFLLGGLLCRALPTLPRLGGLLMTPSALLLDFAGGLFLAPLALLGGRLPDDTELALPGLLFDGAGCFLADLGLVPKSNILSIWTKNRIG